MIFQEETEQEGKEVEGSRVLYPKGPGWAAAAATGGEGRASAGAGSARCTRTSLPAAPACPAAACQSKAAAPRSSAGQPELGSAPADPPGAAHCCCWWLCPNLKGNKSREIQLQSNLYQVTALSSPQSHGNKDLFCFKPFLEVSVAGLDQDFIKIRDKDEVLPPRDPPKFKIQVPAASFSSSPLRDFSSMSFPGFSASSSTVLSSNARDFTLGRENIFRLKKKLNYMMKILF